MALGQVIDEHRQRELRLLCNGCGARRVRASRLAVQRTSLQMPAGVVIGCDLLVYTVIMLRRSYRGEGLNLTALEPLVTWCDPV